MDNQGCCPTKSAEKNSCSTNKGDCAPSKCCWMTLLKGAFLGGLVMFAVCFISWSFLPFHAKTFMSFANEAQVTTALTKNAPASGIYTLPNMASMDAASKAAEPTEIKPFAFVSVFNEGVNTKDMAKCMFKGFLFFFFASLLLTKILKKAAASGKCCPVGCSMIIGLLAALFAYVPNMIWFHFPLHYSLLGMADVIVSFALAGLFISKLVLKSGSGNCGSPSSCDTQPKKGGCCG